MHTLSSAPKLTVSAWAMLSSALVMKSMVDRHELGAPSNVRNLLRKRYALESYSLEESKDVS